MTHTTRKKKVSPVPAEPKQTYLEEVQEAVRDLAGLACSRAYSDDTSGDRTASARIAAVACVASVLAHLLETKPTEAYLVQETVEGRGEIAFARCVADLLAATARTRHDESWEIQGAVETMRAQATSLWLVLLGELDGANYRAVENPLAAAAHHMGQVAEYADHVIVDYLEHGRQKGCKLHDEVVEIARSSGWRHNGDAYYAGPMPGPRAAKGGA